MTREDRRAAMRTWTNTTLIHWGVQFSRNLRGADRENWRHPFDDLRQVCIERGLITELDAEVAKAAAEDRAEAARLAAMREDMLRMTQRKDSGT